MAEIQDWRREVSSNNPLVWQPDGAKASARQQAIGHHFTIAGLAAFIAAVTLLRREKR